MAVNSCKLFDETSAWSSNEGRSVIIGEQSTTTAAEKLTADESKFSNPTTLACPTPSLDKVHNLNNNNNNNNSCSGGESMPGCDVKSCQLNGRASLSESSDCVEHQVTAASGEAGLLTNSPISVKSSDTSFSELNQEGSTPIPSQNDSSNPAQLETIPSAPDSLESVKRPSSEESVEGADPMQVEDVIRDPEWIEERFKVDRRKLEQMLQAGSDGRGQTGEDFFNSIMTQTNTQITWPSKLKIGAKSKKDPHIKVSGKQADVARAKELTMQVLDTKCTRVTLKMDVSHTEHSHVIGKGGNNIKRVMEETGCHIHFPDSNRNSTAEKSNQVSIAGQPSGVEMARAKIRELLPIVVTFDLAVTGSLPDANSAPIQRLVQLYSVSVQFRQRAKTYCTTTCTVRGSNDNVTGLVEGTQKLMQHLTGGAVVQVTSQMEVAPQQHSYMMGRNAVNIKHITNRTGAQIRFPEPNGLSKKSTIYVTGSVKSVVMARQRLMSCLPLVLMFDMKQEEGQSSAEEASRNSQLMETLDVFISIKLKPKQPSKSVIVKSVERNIYNMFEARRQLLKLNSTGLKTPPPPASPPPLNLSSPNNIGPGPPIILTHAPSPRLISYVPNGVTIVQRPATPTTPIIRQGWTGSPMPSPSQSPYPLSHQATLAAIQAQQQQHLLLQAQINAAASNNLSRASSLAGSPPTSQQRQDDDVEPSPLRVTQHLIQNNAARQQERDANGNFPLSQGGDLSPTHANSRAFDENVRNIRRHIMEVHGGNISANSSFNKGNSTEKGLPHRHSLGQMVPNQREDAANHGQRHSLAEGMDLNKVLLQVSNSRNMMGMSTPPGSDRNSPMSVLSERIVDVRIPSPDGASKVISMHKSPSSSSSSADLQASLRNIQTSPNRGYLHPDLAKDRRFAMMERKNVYPNSNESPSESELRDLTEYFGEPPMAPPPGFEKLTESDYENRKKMAYQAMQVPPNASEIRKPTDHWAGYYFSHSMPVNELKKAKEAKHNQKLATTYEQRDDVFEGRDVPEPNTLAMSQTISNSSSGSSALINWRERQNLSHSIHSQVSDLGDSLPMRRQHLTFDPYSTEYLKHSIPTPPHPNDEPSPPPQYLEQGKDPGPGLKYQPLEAALSLLTDNHLSGPNCVDLQDLLTHLNLGKYSEIFAKQEVDLQTFLTLTESDLTELGITVFGPRKKILRAIEELNKNRSVLYNGLNAAPGTPGMARGSGQMAPSQQGNLLVRQDLGGLLKHGGTSMEAPAMPSSRSRARETPSHGSLSSSRLLNSSKGIVSQSGRW